MSSTTGSSESLDLLIQSCDPKVIKFVSELEAINSQLQDEIVRLEATNVSVANKVKALQKELAKASNVPSINVTLQMPDGTTKPLSQLESPK